MSAKPEIIYVGDPMCSWCWGMAPVVETLSGRDDVSMRVVLGGLRPGPNAQQLDDELRRFLRAHWDKVGEVSGQPFSSRALERENWMYDTELPAIAVTTMRAYAPHQALRFFTRLQQAFYVEGTDITRMDEYPSLVAAYDVEPAGFVAELGTDTARARAWADFAEARELGVLGFPTLLLAVDGTLQVLSRGYASLDHFENQLTYWVEGKQPASASEYTCSRAETC